MIGSFDVVTMLMDTGVSLVLGLIIASIYMYKSSYTKSFVVTLVLLPAIVMSVISLVNGSVGTGLAVMGAFSLVRFRSLPGTAKEIVFLFLAMSVGLATGTSFLVYAVVFTLVIGAAALLLYTVSFGEQKFVDKELKITVPENMNYYGLFDDLFEEYTESSKLMKVKTTNMGSLFQLTYTIRLKDQEREKDFLDKVRCRNGNLDIVCGYSNISGTSL